MWKCPDFEAETIYCSASLEDALFCTVRYYNVPKVLLWSLTLLKLVTKRDFASRCFGSVLTTVCPDHKAVWRTGTASLSVPSFANKNQIFVDIFRFQKLEWLFILRIPPTEVSGNRGRTSDKSDSAWMSCEPLHSVSIPVCLRNGNLGMRGIKIISITEKIPIRKWTL